MNLDVVNGTVPETAGRLPRVRSKNRPEKFPNPNVAPPTTNETRGEEPHRNNKAPPLRGHYSAPVPLEPLHDNVFQQDTQHKIQQKLQERMSKAQKSERVKAGAEEAGEEETYHRPSLRRNSTEKKRNGQYGEVDPDQVLTETGDYSARRNYRHRQSRGEEDMKREEMSIEQRLRIMAKKVETAIAKAESLATKSDRGTPRGDPPKTIAGRAPKDPSQGYPPDHCAKQQDDSQHKMRPSRDRWSSQARATSQSSTARDSSKVPGPMADRPSEEEREPSKSNIQAPRGKQREKDTKAPKVVKEEVKKSVSEIREEKAIARRKQRDEIYAMNALMKCVEAKKWDIFLTTGVLTSGGV